MQNMAHFRNDRCGTAISRIYMQPYIVLLCDRGDFRYGFDRRWWMWNPRKPR